MPGTFRISGHERCVYCEVMCAEVFRQRLEDRFDYSLQMPICDDPNVPFPFAFVYSTTEHFRNKYFCWLIVSS